jgi:hypothetical protein
MMKKDRWDEAECRRWAALGHVRAREHGIDYYDCLRAFDAPNASTHISLWMRALGNAQKKKWKKAA